MQGYYDPWPLVSLSKPIAVSGFFGARTGQVVWSTASRLGLPMIDVERRLEHDVGMSSAAWLAQRGAQAWFESAASIVAKATRERPFGLWVLGPHVLLDARARRIVQSATVHVHLRQTATERLDALEAAARQPSPALRLWLRDGESVTAGGQRMLEERAPGFGLAALRIDRDGLHPSQVADRLIQWIHEGAA